MEQAVVPEAETELLGIGKNGNLMRLSPQEVARKINSAVDAALRNVRSKALAKATANTGLTQEDGPKHLSPEEKNALFLKGWSKAVVDKVSDGDFGVLGKLVEAMAIDKKKGKKLESPIEQYTEAMAQLEEEFKDDGVAKYELRQITKDMDNKGFIVVSKVKGRNMMVPDATELGLDDRLLATYLKGLSVSLNSKNIQGTQKVAAAASAPKLTAKDFNTLFKPICSCNGSPTSMGKAACGKAAKGKQCEWFGAWKGQLQDADLQ
jgi:hypothetical protein